MSGQAISVTELNNYIKGLVEQDAMLANDASAVSFQTIRYTPQVTTISH